MTTKTDLLNEAKAMGLSLPAKIRKEDIERAIETAKAAAQFQTVERPQSRRGRKPIPKPGLDRLKDAWQEFPVNNTIPVPDSSGSAKHKDVTLDRFHFRKRVAEPLGLRAGEDFVIETHPELGAIVTRLK